MKRNEIKAWIWNWILS